ncbi:MAG: hypothetical protein HKUEN02_22080 [Anaerolineaceae bacterium]|nr:MAG: hypothetical protein HKUEN02_22080 [Anaerolineaceae bacterium]
MSSVCKPPNETVEKALYLEGVGMMQISYADASSRNYCAGRKAGSGFSVRCAKKPSGNGIGSNFRLKESVSEGR